MATIVALTTEVVHRNVYELRYEYGQIYWDRAGRIARDLLGDLPEWTFDAIDINTCKLSCADKNMALTFGHAKIDLVQIQNADVEEIDSAAEFARIADVVTGRIVNLLDVNVYTRIGFRSWRLFPTHDSESSEEAVKRLKLCSIDDGLVGEIGELSEVSHRLVVDRPRHKVRIAVSPFEQSIEIAPGVLQQAKMAAKSLPVKQRKARIDALKAKKKIDSFPQFGVLLDLDASIDDPPFPDSLSVADFIVNAANDFDATKQLILTAK